MEYEFDPNAPAAVVAANMLGAIRGPQPFDTAAAMSEQTRYSGDHPPVRRPRFGRAVDDCLAGLRRGRTDMRHVDPLAQPRQRHIYPRPRSRVTAPTARWHGERWIQLLRRLSPVGRSA